MAGNIGVIVEGDRDVAIRFDQFPQDCHDRLKSRIQVLTARLTGEIRARVPRKTGKLASEVVGRVSDSKSRITGSVTFSGDYAKAGALEWGAHGTAKVRAHQAQLTQVFGHRLASPVTVLVEAHTRQMNIVAKRFLRGPFEADKADIEAQLQQAVGDAVEQGDR